MRPPSRWEIAATSDTFPKARARGKREKVGEETSKQVQGEGWVWGRKFNGAGESRVRPKSSALFKFNNDRLRHPTSLSTYKGPVLCKQSAILTLSCTPTLTAAP